MKRWIAFLCALVMLLSLVGCRQEMTETDGNVLEIAVLESAYGIDMWKDIAARFEETHAGVTVQLTADRSLEDLIGAQMKAGDYPDFVHLATGREAGLTETMIKDYALEDLTDVLSMTVPGEEETVREKLIDGFADTLATNPYGDGATYLAPMFYSPCGLFYNASLFREKGWAVPETWEDMWTLGDRVKAEGYSLFTYPTAGYFDTLFYALLCEAGGATFFNSCMRYEDGVWESDTATKVFEIIEKLAEYTEPTTVANANNENFLKNQQLVLENKALFMPNGTWVVDEMADAPRAEGFEWGFTAVPAIEGERCAYTFFEQSWIPKEADNIPLAKEFMAYLYSDEAAAIFASYGAVQPIEDFDEDMLGEDRLFYDIYDDGDVTAVMGGFAAAEAVAGVSMNETLFGTIDSVMSGDKTAKEWQEAVEAASDKLRGVKL